MLQRRAVFPALRHSACIPWSDLRVHGSLLLLIPVLLIVATTLFTLTTDPDYWWHVRTGQYIYETSTLPRTDIYSYTAIGHPWVTHEWLSELLFYLLTRLGGYRLVTAVFALLTTLTWSFVYATCRRRGLGEVGAVLVMLVGFVISAGSLNVRPQALTALLVAACMLIITRYLAGETRSLYFLPPLFALWVNLHGGYIIGFVLLGLALVGQSINGVLRRSSVSLRPLLTTAFLSALAALLNPHGFAALTYPFSYLGSDNASMLYIAEWQSPDFHRPIFLAFAASLILAMIVGLSKRPLGCAEVLFAVVFTFLALRSARQIPLYVIVVLPLLGARLREDVPILGRNLAAWRTTWLIALVWPLSIVLTGALIIRVGGPAQMQVMHEPSGRTYPVGAVQYLRQNKLTGHLFNEYDWGGYLIYQLYPQQRVFIDGRADVYGDEFVERYIRVISLRPGWQDVLDEYDVDLVLVRGTSPLAVVLGDRPDWHEIYAGDTEKIFARQDE